MRSNNTAIISTRSLAIDLVGELLYWPLWWYSRGLLKTTIVLASRFRLSAERLGVRVWFRNLFVPMYGQYDWEGRIISFVIRSIQIVSRALSLAVLLFFLLILLVGWVVLPVFVAYQAYQQTTWFFQ